jgi:transcriptional regulator with XRE-family HTH domain
MSSVPDHGRLPALHTRIRKRRSERRLTGTELAQRAGISTSYVSLIENGAKIPDEDVAARLAQALDDDPALYRAWARAARLGLHDLALLNELDTIARTPAFASLVESGRELPRLEATSGASPRQPATPSDLADRLREVAFRLDPAMVAGTSTGAVVPAAAVVNVPELVSGADPADLATAGSRIVRGRLLLDPHLLGGHRPDELFAYAVAERDTKHLRGLASPGDRVVLRRNAVLDSDRICAVRTAAGIVLSRVLVRDRSLLLLPGEGEIEFESVELPLPGETAGVVVGTHVLLIRG